MSDLDYLNRLLSHVEALLDAGLDPTQRAGVVRTGIEASSVDFMTPPQLQRFRKELIRDIRSQEKINSGINPSIGAMNHQFVD